MSLSGPKHKSGKRTRTCQAADFDVSAAVSRLSEAGVNFSCLVIGYGNTLRRDDGAGAELAAQIERQRLPGVKVLISPQLFPEFAEPISQAQAVVFLDAAEGVATPSETRAVLPARAWRADSHLSDPAVLLALAKHLFGRAPRAWSILMAGDDFALGEGLSDRAKLSLAWGAKAFAELRMQLFSIKALPSDYLQRA